MIGIESGKTNEPSFAQFHVPHLFVALLLKVRPDST